MTKEQYAAQLARAMREKGLKFTRDDAIKFIAALTKSLVGGLIRDRKITLSNFGIFIVSKYTSKIIRSPRPDKKRFFMPPTDVIKWKPSGLTKIRGGSMEIPDSEYEKLKGSPQPEFEDFVSPPTEDLPKRRTPFAVEINVGRKDNLAYFSDQDSPLSRFTQRILEELIETGAEKAELRPGKAATRLIYLAQNQPLLVCKIPKISHQIIVEKIKSISHPEPEFLPDEKVIPFSESEKIKIYSLLTPFGELLVLERI